MQFRCTFATQPNQHSGRIDPVKGGNFARDSDRVIALQTLQGLYDENAVVNFTVGAPVAMHAFPLKKELPFHGGPSPHAAPRELR